MEMNINDYVYVRVTEVGKKIYKAYFDKFNFPAFGLSPPELKTVGLLKEWARFQLWDLMAIFGPEIRIGGETMFENNIIRFNPPF